MLPEIKIKIGESNKPQIEDLSLILDTSIFCNQYKFALSAIDHHLRAQIRKCKDVIASQVDYDNNIFAFIGDRGSGKTSCMMSIVKYLTLNDNKENYPSISKRRFIATDLIDPAFFDEKHNIVSMFLAKLYNQYQDWSLKCGQTRTGNTREKERKLIESFHKAQRHLNYILYFSPEENKEELEDLQQLSLMSSAIELRQNIKELVRLFFELTQGNSDYILILPIDDIDLNTDGAERMSEQIRKYLIQDNIIVVMSLKLDQLSQIKRGKFLSSYEKLIEKRYMTDEEIDQMVEKYMVKFLPQGHRIYMPDSSYYMNANVCLEVNGQEASTLCSPLMMYIPEQIFLKTRYLFYNNHHRQSYIIPQNLRELVQITTLLYNMEDFRNNQVENAYNQTLFKKYIFEDWIDSNLSIGDRKRARELNAISDYSILNKRTLNILTERFSLKEKNYVESISIVSAKETARITEIKTLIKGNSISYNVSFGDVFSFVDMLDRLSTNEEDLRFLFIIKTIYSIKLYEAYNEVTEFDESMPMEDMLGKKDSGLSLLNAYEKFVAGRFVNPRINDVLPYDSETKMPRSDRPIGFDKLRELISECSAYNTVESIQEHKDQIRLAEFFMLCILRDVDTKNYRDYDKDYRERRTINFADSLALKKKNAFFDVNAFFFNITRIKSCYARFKDGDKLYENLDLHDTQKISLWGNFKEAAKELRPNQTNNGTEFNSHAWLSTCAFRNFEIIQDFYDTVGNDSNYESTSHKCLSRFFKRVANYSIKTYDTSNGGERHCIDFSFVKVIAEWLDALTGEEEGTPLRTFNIIYNPLVGSESAINEPKLVHNDGIRQIDVKSFMSYRRNRVSKKDNVSASLYNQYPFLKTIDNYNEMAENILRQFPAIMQPPMIEQALDQINERIQQLNGQH